MKLYNRELEEIENKERERRIQAIAEKNISFLVEKYGIDESFLRKRLESLSVVEREGKTHFVVQNGKKHEINSNAPASFVTKKNMEYDGEKWTFENAVYTNDNNGDHTITHELFHYFAENTEMDFDTNNIGYDKRGVSIQGYDRDDGEIDVGMKARGLNEGITEMLAMQVDNINKPNTYDNQVYLASILINSQDNSLINAYFSEDAKKFQEFLKDFDSRQSTTSSKELVSLSMIVDGMIDTKLLKGCLEYSLSYCQNMEQLKNERTRLLSIFKSMDNNPNIEFTDENFNLKKFFNETLLTKRQEIEKTVSADIKIDAKNIAKQFARDKDVALKKEDTKNIFQQLEMEQNYTKESPSLAE